MMRRLEGAPARLWRDSGPRRAVICLVTIGLCAGALPATSVPASAALSPATFLVGAATADITPTFYPAGDAPVPSTCPGGAAVWNGKRYFDFEDAYQPNPTVHQQNGAPIDEYSLGDSFCKLDPAPVVRAEYGHPVITSGRYEGIFLAGGSGMGRIAKALAGSSSGPLGQGISSQAIFLQLGDQKLILVVVDSIGTFSSDFDRVRHLVAADNPALAGVPIVFSSTHNESAPDPIGIWGTNNPAGAPLITGVDHLYMDFFVQRTARAVERAAGVVSNSPGVTGTSPTPSRLRVTEATDPANFIPCFSSYPYLAERRIHVLQAVNARAPDPNAKSATIVTLVQYGMHDELMGFSGEPPSGTAWRPPDANNNRGYYRRVLGGDAQGFVRRALQDQLGGIGVGMGGAVGSVEMPLVFTPGTAIDHTPLFHTVNANPGGPTDDVPGKYDVQGDPDPSHPQNIAYGDCGRTAYPLPNVAPMTTDQVTRAQLIGSFLVQDAKDALSRTPFSTSRTLTSAATPDFFVPLLDNNLFLAAAHAGLFPDRPVYTGVVGGPFVPDPTGMAAGDGLVTHVTQARIADSEFVTLPGEMFPQTTIRGYLGPQQMAFPDQPITPWLAARMSAPHRFFMGLGEDMIGYMMPPGNFVGDCQNVGVTCVPNSNEDPWRTWEMQGHSGQDRFGEHHSDDSESIGPIAASLVAAALDKLVTTEHDPSARQLRGRYIDANGKLDRLPINNPVGVVVLPDGVTSFSQRLGSVYLLPGKQLPASCASHGVKVSGPARTWMDYLGHAESSSDESTAGIISRSGARVYVDVYADLSPGSCGGLP